MITDAKWQQLRARMLDLEILESDLDEKFIKGSGSGGQKVNKTASCVYLSHAKSGVSVKCQKTRSREDNRFFARRLLCEQVEYKTTGQMSQKEKMMAKIKKQKKRRRRRNNSD
jgi:peptide chain release factor